MRFSTKAIRVGQDPEAEHGSVIQPIYQSATFAWKDLGSTPKFDYTRVHNPGRATLEEVLAALENGTHCTCTGSGMAAIAAALSLLQSGDHLLMATDIYGGTHRIVHSLLPRYGITCTEFDAADPKSLARAARPNSKMAIFETPTNPIARVVDIAEIASEALRLGLTTVVDNTFASPYLQNPLDLGIDIVVHSTTKYISGHSDIIGGALITNSAAIHEHVFEWAKTVGTPPSPFDCWLTLRGVKTLGVRMRQHCANAMTVARFLDSHPKAARVHYPGLESHPDHALAARQMRAFGGMMAFEVAGTSEDAMRVAESTKVFILAESLGGVESLIGYPAMMSHASMSEAQRTACGIQPTCLRLSVGIEDEEDLIEDLAQALAAVPDRVPASA